MKNRKYSIVWRLNETGRKTGRKKKVAGKEAEALLCRALIKKYATTDNLAKKLIRKNGLPMLGLDGENINTARGDSFRSSKVTGSQDLVLTGFPKIPPNGEGIEWKLENIWIPKNTTNQTDVYVLWTNYAKESLFWRPDNADRQQILWKFHCKDDTNQPEQRLFNVKERGEEGESGAKLDNIFVDDNRDSLAALRQALYDIQQGKWLSGIITEKDPKRAIYAIDKYIKDRLSDGNNFSVKVNLTAGIASCSSYRISNREKDSKIEYSYHDGSIFVTSGDITYSLHINNGDIVIKRYSGDQDFTRESNQLLPSHHLFNSIIDDDWLEEIQSAQDERFLRLCGSLIIHKSKIVQDGDRTQIKKIWPNPIPKGYPNPFEKEMTIDDAFKLATGDTKRKYLLDGGFWKWVGTLAEEDEAGLSPSYLLSQGLLKKLPPVQPNRKVKGWDENGKQIEWETGKRYDKELYEWTFDLENTKKTPIDWFESIIKGTL